MADPLQPETQNSTLREFDRRLRALETAPRAVATSVTNGSFIVYDGSGNELVRLGQMSDGVNYGIQVQNENGQIIFRATSAALIDPQNAVPLYANGGADTGTSFRPGTSSGTYFELWRGDFWSVAPNVTYDITIYPNFATMDWRILIYESGGTPTVAYTELGQTVNAQRSGAVAIPLGGLISGTDPIGRAMTMRLEARVASGAGTVDISINAAAGLA